MDSTARNAALVTWTERERALWWLATWQTEHVAMLLAERAGGTNTARRERRTVLHGQWAAFRAARSWGAQR